MGQRKSDQWKTAWQTYCTMFGNGKNDPAHYDDAFIIGFVDFVGELGSQSLQAQAAEQGIIIEDVVAAGGNKRPLGGAVSQMPPAKRMAGGRGYAGADAFGGGEKQRLVDKIKAMQRSNPDAKAAWWRFCDDQAQGIKDPNRHDENMLEQFLSSME